jgi:hypothetical protein
LKLIIGQSIGRKGLQLFQGFLLRQNKAQMMRTFSFLVVRKIDPDFTPSLVGELKTTSSEL